jgi:hypothetical protein
LHDRINCFERLPVNTRDETIHPAWLRLAHWINALAINGTVYLLLNGITRRLASKFFPLSFKALADDLASAMKVRVWFTLPAWLPWCCLSRCIW